MQLARVIVADPAWLFGDSLPGNGRGASKHYGCLPTTGQAGLVGLGEEFDLTDVKLPPLAPDCLLFMWRVASMQAEALRLGRAWGFGEPKSELVWVKKTRHGKRFMGMGRYVRMEHEVCLIFARGRGASLIQDHGVRSTFEAPVGRHSEKPDAFYELVERLVPGGPFVEMFARKPRPGWICVGNELPGGCVDMTGVSCAAE